VLYSVWDEFDLTKWRYGTPPESTYFPTLLRQMDTVETRIADHHANQATVATTPSALEDALRAGTLALVHTIEGGFHVGESVAAIEANVAELGRRGVLSIAPAHLIYRAVATNAPAFPFMPDWLYHVLFRQPQAGLTDLGEALVRAMVQHGLVVDVTHMSERSLQDTFALLDELDPGRRVPVIASHMACRFGRLQYNTTDRWIARVAERGGVLGVIFCEHYVSDGLGRGRTQSFEETFERICRHVDRIHRVTGSHEHAAIGSDLDGYIKPTLCGLEHMGRMPALAAALSERYGDAVSKLICSENALRTIRAGWQINR
jgi:microsomal dipeptidase-like Zn-dependent dipeptidase